MSTTTSTDTIATGAPESVSGGAGTVSTVTIEAPAAHVGILGRVLTLLRDAEVAIQTDEAALVAWVKAHL